jgi:hypothetical protein
MSSQQPDSDLALENLFPALRSRLGSLPIRRPGDAPGSPIVYYHPGAHEPLVIHAHPSPVGTVLRIDAPVSAYADWHTDGLAEMLLREQADWIFGRIEHAGDGIVLEHNLMAGRHPGEVAAIVHLLASTACRLRYELFSIGALTTTKEVT